MNQLSKDEIRIENIQHIRLNGLEATLFNVYRKHHTEDGNEHFVFSEQDSLNGTIKRESTIIKKLMGD